MNTSLGENVLDDVIAFIYDILKTRFLEKVYRSKLTLGSTGSIKVEMLIYFGSIATNCVLFIIEKLLSWL